MKKIIASAVVLLVLVSVGAVAYRVGWLAKLGVPLPGVSPAGAPASAPGTTPAAPGAAAPSNGAPGPPGSPGGPAGTQAPIPAAAFDGNVASINFGGTVESTSENYGDTVDHSYIIDGDPKTAWRNAGSSRSIGEIVFSFFAREAMLVDAVVVHGGEASDEFPRDVEVWASTAATAGGPFTKVAAASLPKAAEGSVSFSPVEARFLKFRMLKNQVGEDQFYVTDLKVHETQRAGYTPLLTRHPELALAGGPVALPGGRPVASATIPPCAPRPAGTGAGGAFAPPAHPESSRILIVGPTKGNYMSDRILEQIQSKSLKDGVPEAELGVLKRARISQVFPESARPAMLAPANGVDTVVLAQICDIKNSVQAAFKQALVTWVAAGHKLIIQDSDDCHQPGPDYSFLPYLFQADVPGALGAEGSDLRFIESNAMLQGRPGRPSFLDAKSWSTSVSPFRNELGDANTLVGWDANWCGHMAVRNAHGVFGFNLVYAHYGRGLIIYDGFDNDQGAEYGYDTVLVREIAQPFDPDNLPCAARLGDFVVTTDSWLIDRAAVPGRAYSYPLTLLSNQGYKGTVNLDASASPGLSGLLARFEPATVALSGEERSMLTVTLPTNASPARLAI
jgi:hypothetical protein